jgi:hypothetical protein
MRDYYWFQRNHFVLAVDAVSLTDAREYAKRSIPGAEYLGHYPAPGTPTTACGGVTDRRQEQISASLRRQMLENV